MIKIAQENAALIKFVFDWQLSRSQINYNKDEEVEQFRRSFCRKAIPIQTD
jgi:hypothetical protein